MEVRGKIQAMPLKLDDMLFVAPFITSRNEDNER